MTTSSLPSPARELLGERELCGTSAFFSSLVRKKPPAKKKNKVRQKISVRGHPPRSPYFAAATTP
jgi:hypothetical protein